MRQETLQSEIYWLIAREGEPMTIDRLAFFAGVTQSEARAAIDTMVDRGDIEPVSGAYFFAETQAAVVRKVGEMVQR